ncbi:hypothetical protein T492DRAFT_875140, partial [Pavlovales sp. CCMP2436]
MEAAARIKKQLIDTIGTIAARGHAQLLLARLSALAPIAVQRGNTTNSNQQIISLNALARTHYRRSIGTRAPLARLFYATLDPKYPIFVTGKGGGLTPMGRDGETGVAQGSVEAGVAFAISIHPELKVLDAELRPYGGGARAGHDDVRACGPLWIVFSAMQRFHDALFLRLGLVVQPSKCECWIDEAHIASLDAHRGLVTRSHLLDGALTPHYGVMCYGVPIGSEEYVKLALAGKCDEIASISNKLIAMLSSSHKQQLWLLTLFSTARKFEYFAHHCYSDLARDACTRFDAIIHTQATHALGVSLDDDQLATARLALPRRYWGAGLRRMIDIAPAAFCGAMTEVVPNFLDIVDEPTGTITQRGMLELPQEAWPMKDLTENREAQRFDALKMRINALPRGDRVVHLVRSIDRNSSAWVAALPIGYGACTIDEWVEITARFFG